MMITGFRENRFALAFIFLGIFLVKMAISGAPVVFSYFDKKFMKTVIMQLEEECKGEDSESPVKYTDQKVLFQEIASPYMQLVITEQIADSFFEQSRRYVNPYYPFVPTPPPNFS